jgi:choline dehydrogenase
VFIRGGSSSTNAMIWHCGNDRDYDNWAKEGNPGWEYKNILPLIKKVERNTNPTLVNDHPYYHGTNGKVYVSSFDPKDDYTDVIKTSFTQSNYKQVDDINSGNATGVTNMQFTIENGHRCSAAWAFLRTCKYCGYDSNRNLHLIKRSLATRVIFKGKKAVGVEVVTDNVKCPDLYFKARREIVISAGAFNTPRLLMQSGIGRKVELDKFNIKQIADLPVGENYQDHVFIQSFLRVKQIESELDPTTLLAISFRYLYSRKGKLAELGLLSTQAFINTEDKNAKYPNIQYYFYRFNLKSEALVVYCETYKIKKEYVQTLLEINQYEEIILVMTTLLTPKSKGTVKLSSSNPRSAPKITTNFLSSEEDRVTLEKALGILNEVVNNDAFQSRGARIVDFKIDECEPLASSSNYTQCYMRYFSDTEYHYCGTARMGRRCKNDTVVDENLRIHGLSNIRVADASIMPRITSGNTQCPVYAIGMKAAELIKQDLNYSKENLIILGGSHHICPGDCHDKDKEIENEKRKKIIEIENEKKRMDENEKRKQQIENENRNKWQKGNSNENSFESRNQKKQSDFNEENNYYDDDNNDFQNNNFDQDNNGFDGSYEN